MPRDAAIAYANPPLPFTRDAIVNQLRRQATNGPAYVQHSATKALAHLKGLYAEARYEARLAYEAARDALGDAAQEATEKISDAFQRVVDLQNGAKPTAEELAYLDPPKPAANDEDDKDDEDHEAEQEDEPP